MRGTGAWGIAAMLVLGLAVGRAQADEPNGDSSKSSGGSKYIGDRAGHFTNLLFGPPQVGNKIAKPPSSEKYQTAPHLTQTIAHDPQRDINAVLRRVQVCDRLRQIAEQSGNAELHHQADELEARAWSIYHRHAEASGSPIGSPNAETNALGTGSDSEGSKRPTRKPVAKPSDSPQQLGIDADQDEEDRTGDVLRGRGRL